MIGVPESRPSQVLVLQSPKLSTTAKHLRTRAMHTRGPMEIPDEHR